MANERFKRRCPVSSHRSWDAWSICYEWIDHKGRLHEGDTIAFVERLERDPYPALVVGTVTRLDHECCRISIVAHDADFGPEPGAVVTRPVEKLLGGALKRWPRRPSVQGSGYPMLPYFVPPTGRDV